MNTLNFYQNELDRYKRVSGKKSYITRTLKELNSTLNEARQCDKYYLGESKYRAILECNKNIDILIEIRKKL